MPAFTLGMFQLTLIMRLVRSEMMEVLRTDYIKFARARGLTNRTVHFGHALKKHLGPGHYDHRTSTWFDYCLCDHYRNRVSMAGDGAVVSSIDPICRCPCDVDLSHSDCPFFFVVINLIVDILYHVVDPRLRFDKSVVLGH